MSDSNTPPAIASPALPSTLSSRLLRWATSGWAVVFMLACYYALAVSATAGKCNAFDEMAHLTGGYSYWRTNEYRLHLENGNLPQRIAGAALLGGDFVLPDPNGVSWRSSDVWGYGQQLVYEVNGRRADEMWMRGRAAMGLVGVAVGLSVWALSRRLFGPVGAMISLVLFCFCPTMLAHGPLITSDMTATLFFTLSLVALWSVLHRVTPLMVLATGVVVAGLALSKASVLLLLPMAVLLLALRFVSSEPLRLGWGWRATHEQCNRLVWFSVFAGVAAAVLSVTVFLIWLSFGFRYRAMLPSSMGGDKFVRDWGWVMANADAPRSILYWLAQRHWLPEAYLYGTILTLRSTGERSAFLLGRYSETGWWWFFPYTFLVKTPLPLFCMLPLSLAAAWRRSLLAAQTTRWRSVFSGLYLTTPLWVLLLVYGTFAVTSHINIGHRHLIPIYPAIFVLAGAAGWWFQRSTQWARAAVLVLLCLFVVDSLATRPNYLAYFNQSIGSRDRAYRHLVDSNLDWGQELPALRRWLDAQGLNGASSETTSPNSADGSPGAIPVYLSYFGTGSARYYGINATMLPSYLPQPADPLPSLPRLRGGVYCLSATMLQCVYLDAPGSWSDRHEKNYEAIGSIPLIQRMLTLSDDQQREAMIELYMQAKQNPDPAQRQRQLDEFGDFLEAMHAFSQLRLSRLCAMLRQREPQAQIAHSILIFTPNDSDVEAALDPNRPPPIQSP